MAAKVPETMAASAVFVEDQIEGPYIFGEALTLADPYLYSITNWLAADGVDTADFPKLMAFKSAMEQRASVQKAIADGYFG
jgi:glutathione S-transferase